MRCRPRVRPGFTIVELLVAMALIVFIMAILSQAFVSATKSFRDLKAAGDMAERLRGVTQILSRDLAADHFEGRKRLSDWNFWNNGPPREGFIRIYNGSGTNVAPNVDEGADIDGIHAYRSINHTLQYTVKLRGNQRSDFFQGFVPTPAPLLTSPGLGVPQAHFQDSGTYSSQWAEVVLFLVQVPDTANGTPLYSLYRRQRLVVPDNSLVNGVVPVALANQYAEISTTVAASATNLYFNSPLDLTMPARRFGMDPTQWPGATVPGWNSPISFPVLAQQNPGPQFSAADLLLTDVISFDVRVLADNNPDFYDLQTLVGLGYTNNNFTNNQPSFGGGQALFDTWSSARDDVYDYTGWAIPGSPSSIPMWKNANTGSLIRIKAIQITIRIWDLNTQQTRQVTIVQDM